MLETSTSRDYRRPYTPIIRVGMTQIEYYNRLTDITNFLVRNDKIVAMVSTGNIAHMKLVATINPIRYVF